MMKSDMDAARKLVKKWTSHHTNGYYHEEEFFADVVELIKRTRIEEREIITLALLHNSRRG